MFVFREAKITDANSIANLHAKSWQQNYRGSFSDEFLDNEVLDDRLNEWTKRLQNQSNDQYLILLEEDDELQGFICAYFGHDAQFGTLLDNLHVSLNTQGKGGGTQLMISLAKEILKRNKEKGFYLWVLDSNAAAISFYDKLGGVAVETVESNEIGDTPFLKIRYVWNDANVFLTRVAADK
ncbi:GNAT family N-acetyltransferase [uncultured Maribacter sp.]|uniref:GNAT family N-acetyltransferase n=1 Tax=uncultured Maribacter sp. TaxID=431308 RepID=UPI0030DD008C|tara:strand:- start:2312 stop:2854 length:543 start_codon:yes stop_codon:yes gene_type:complete